MTYNTKQRLISFLGFLFFTLISVAVFYAGIYLLYSYHTHQSVVVLSYWSVFAILFPLFFMPYALMLIPVFMHKKKHFRKIRKDID